MGYKLTDTDKSMEVTSMKGGGEWWEVNGAKYMVTEDYLTLGDGHTM